MKRINTRESGQALVEYILIMMIVVLISVGLLYQFNRSVRDYINVFFGEYISCLIASGQLPSLGSGESTDCEIPSFSFNNSDDMEGDGSSSSSASSDRSTGNVNNRSGLISTNESGRTSGVGGGSSSGSNTVPISGEDEQSDDADSASGRSSRVAISGDTQDSFGAEGLNSGRVRNVPIDGKDADSEQTTEQAQNNQLLAQDTVGQTRLVPISQSEGRGIGEEDTDVGLNMAGFIKWLFIIGIIIAIVVLLLMQALQIKKGLEK